MDERSLVRLFLNPWVIGSAFIVALLLTAGTLAILLYTRPEPAPSAPATAVLSVIQAPTATQPAPTSTPVPSPTPEQPAPPLEAGALALGDYVQISGTGGDGLRLRAEPGLESEVRLLGAEAEVFEVRDGPSEASGYTWWFLVGVSDDSRRGWAVANFLSVVQNPH